MKILADLLKDVPVLEVKGDANLPVTQVVTDSRQATPGSLYIALKGTAADGHQYIQNAINNGAVAVLAEILPETFSEDVVYVQVKDTAKVLGHIARNFYNHPSKKLKLVGITGTNGKTSTATLLHETFTRLGYLCALLSTVENRIGEKVFPSTHTTPDVLTVNKFLAEAVVAGCGFAFMEVSSHGIHQHRIEGLKFQIAGFTNITHDHLDYHETFAEYLRVKKSFFDHLPSDAVAITNLDDRNGKIVLQNTVAKKVTYALKTPANYHGKIIEADLGGMQLRFNGRDFYTQLTGKFNAYNLLLVYAIALELGQKEDEVLTVLSALSRVPGRFQTQVSPGGIFYIVDYAHTPDALDNVLDSINQIRTKNERLLTVFGAGGDRDKTKRPEMGRIATRKSTLAIITSDNPRTEAPAQIIEDIAAGVEPENFSRFTKIEDRREAIKMAIKFAEPGDILLIAGKGHETYQDIQGVKHHFDDAEVARELFGLMGK